MAYFFKGTEILAPLSITSNEPVFDVDTINLSKQRATQGAQRWELGFNTATSEATEADMLVGVVSGITSSDTMIMPQLPSVNRANTSGVSLGINANASGGSSTVNVSNDGILSKGSFVKFSNHDKVYMVTEGNVGSPQDARRNLLSDTDVIEQKTLDVTPQAYTISFNSGSQIRSEVIESITATAVDVFVYDTSKDSDGGAWRKRTQSTSWYNETLSTATRGSRREFPAVAVIVAEANKVTIYDGDDPALPMWRVLPQTANTIPGSEVWRPTRNASSVYALNALVAWGKDSSLSAGDGLSFVNLASDIAGRYDTTAAGGGIGSPLVGMDIADGLVLDGSLPAIVSALVNDVAMTVLPDAPIDAATGLQVPTIGIFTAGGASIIHNDGTVSDVVCSSGTLTSSLWGEFVDGGLLMCLGSATSTSPGSYVYRFNSIPTVDTTITLNTKNVSAGVAPDSFYSFHTLETYYDLPLAGADALYGSPSKFAGWAYKSRTAGFGRLAENPVDPTKGMVAHITSTYNTGWMNGDIKGAFLSDTDDTDLVGGTDADRSVNANPLTVNGTVTRSPVATGAELVAYSGFSASNYLEQPYNSDLDFGTGDFCVMGWVNSSTTGSQYYFDRGAGPAGRLAIFSSAGNWYLSCSATGGVTDTGIPFTAGLHHVCLIREGGVLKFFLDSTLVYSAVNTSNVTNAIAITTLGIAYSLAVPASVSKMALWRISATAPTAEQIAKIYNDEKVLFQENAACTLYGTSDAVTALAHDSDTDLLHVGTSAGRSVFSGLRRVSNTTEPITTAISAVGGYIAEE